MDISIVIINYNTLQITQDCLDSIFKQTKDVEFEVILVDNNSTDGSKEHFEKDNRITYIYSPVNLGFGRANNLGYKNAKGKYIFCLNSDTILLNNAVKLFFDTMERMPKEVACVGTTLQDANGEYMHSFSEFPTMLGNLKWRLGFPNPRKETPESVPFQKVSFDVDYITGADLFVRRNVIDELGFFDPDFFLYYEETEMEWRYKHHGYRNVMLTAPKIIHLEGGSAKRHTPPLKMLRKLAKLCNSERLYFKKTNSRSAYYYRVLPYVAINYILMVINWGITSVKKKI